MSRRKSRPSITIGFIFAVLAAFTEALSLDQDVPISLEELTTRVSKQLGEDLGSPFITAQALDIVPSPTATESLCTTASHYLTSQQLHESASAAIVLAKLQCPQKKAAVDALPRLWQLALQENTAAGYANVLSAARHLAATSRTSIIPEQTEALGRMLSEIKAPSGKARSQVGAPVSVLATGYAYKIIAEAKALKVQWTGKASSAASEFSSQISEVLEGVSERGFTAAGDGHGLQALSQFLEGLISLDAKAASSKQLKLLAQYVSSFGNVGSFEEAVWLLKAKLALKALGASAVRAELQTPFVTLGEKAVVEIQTLDEQGQATPAGSLQVVVTNNKGKTVAQIDPLHGTQGMYRLDILQHVDSAGQYKLSVTPNPEQGTAAQELTLTVKEPSQYSSATLQVLQDKGQDGEASEVTWPRSMESPLVATADSDIKITLSGATAKSAPVLHLACSSSNKALVASFKKSLTLKIGVDTLQDELQCQEMEATIQPASGATDTIWRLGRVQLRAPAARQSRTDIYAPKPVISHLFRQPDKRPMEALSYLFAGLAALPLLGLVFSLHQCGANVEGLLRNSKQLCLPASVFHSSLVGLTLLYSAFWLRLNLLQTLPLLALLALVLSTSGYFLLSTQAALRLKQM